MTRQIIPASRSKDAAMRIPATANPRPSAARKARVRSTPLRREPCLKPFRDGPPM